MLWAKTADDKFTISFIFLQIVFVAVDLHEMPNLFFWKKKKQDKKNKKQKKKKKQKKCLKRTSIEICNHHTEH